MKYKVFLQRCMREKKVEEPWNKQSTQTAADLVEAHARSHGSHNERTNGFTHDTARCGRFFCKYKST